MYKKLIVQYHLSDAIRRSTINFASVCEKVFEIDDKIRSARIINSLGRLIAGGMKKGLKALEESRRDEMLFLELSLRARMRHEFDEEFGPVKFSLSYRGKIVLMRFPMGEHILFVSAEKQVDLNKIPFCVLEIIKFST